MPSKPKGVSQTSTSHSHAAQNAPWAEVPTTGLEISHEPALQHKKRLDGPPSTFSINLDDGGKSKAYDDFALLGKQQKFANNVPYGLKHYKVSKSVDRGRDLSNKNDNSNDASLSPPLKQTKMTERQSCTQQKQDVTVKEPSSSKKVVGKENMTPITPPPAPRSKDKGTSTVPEKEGLKDKNLADILPKGKVKEAAASKSKDSVNEGVQTNMDKGVMLSHQEAPADYSLKYKAGVAPARTIRKPSEYQKEFTWKNGVPVSPLITAEQIIHQSNTNISPVKQSVLPKKTEYQTRFKTYKLSEPVSLAPKPSQALPQQHGRSKMQLKRSKSVGAGLSPDRIIPAGLAAVTSADDPRLLRESRTNSPIPKVPLSHGKIKHRVTEYRANFKAPAHFNYMGGAWKDAYPAHLLQYTNGDEMDKAESVDKVAEESPSWFAEVLELRRRASEYKKRAQGTHFSREHLVQLMAQQAGYWDADSARSSRVSSLDALALEPARPAAGVPSFTKTEVPVDKVPVMAARGDCVADNDDSGSTTYTKQRPAKKERQRGEKTKMAWQEEAVNTNQNAACDALSTEDVEDDVEELQNIGRLPTPVLKQRREKLQRHHLDRTTPCVGGVLLSTPQDYNDSGDSEYTVTETESQPSPVPKLSTERLNTSPLLGKPTPDTHVLRDDSANLDQPLDVQYIASPQRCLARSDRNLKALQRRMNAKIPPTIDERMGETYSKGIGMFQADDLPLVKTQKDDDALSLSTRSIASSSSLASEVYERAKHRRDHFWGTKSDQ